MANVTPTYPSSLVSYGTDVIDFTDTVLAAHVNTLRAEVISVETVLGTYPTLSSGWVGSFTQPAISVTWNTLKDRINNIEYGLYTTWAAQVPTGGTSGQVLVKNSSTDYDFSWTTANFLPSQSTNNGKFLTTNGTSASWASINQYTAPTLGSTSISSGATVTNINGLTINSTTIPSSKTLVATDSTAYVVPSQTGNSGKYLTTNGSTASWSTVSAGETFNPLLLIGA